MEEVKVRTKAHAIATPGVQPLHIPEPRREYKASGRRSKG